MPGLLDVAASTKTISINGQPVSVYGVSAKGIAYLLERFPVVRELLTGRTPTMDTESLIKMAPDAAAVIISAGVGDEPWDNPEAEKAAGRLGLSEQIELLEAVLQKTMPNGVGPLGEKFKAVGGVLGVEVTNTPATK